MSTTLSVAGVALALFGGATVAGVAVAQALPDSRPPWEMIGGGGAVGAVMACVWVFLKRDEKVRTEHATVLVERDKTIKEIAHDFSQTSTNITAKFADTTAASEERAERREKELREWMHRLTSDKA